MYFIDEEIDWVTRSMLDVSSHFWAVCTYFNKQKMKFDLILFVCLSSEYTRVELADGALMDIFCPMYSVSCKVLNNLYHYSHSFVES